MRVYTVSIANCMQMKMILHASILDAGLRFNEILWFVLCQSVVFLSVWFVFFFPFYFAFDAILQHFLYS